MPNYHATSEGLIPFTAEEEAAWAAEKAAYVPPTAPPAPTKEELLAELQALTTKINALG